MDDELLHKYVDKFYKEEIDKKMTAKEKAISNSIEAFLPIAIERAYSDTKRVCTGIGKYEKEKKSACDGIEKMIKEKFLNPSFDVKKFDGFHEKLCKKWTGAFGENSLLGAYGKAQKIVNMTFKYLYTFSFIKGALDIDKFENCHFTLDSYTLAYLRACKKTEKPEKKDKLKCLNSNTKWSSLIEDDYKTIKDYARDCIKCKYEKWTPLQMEFIIWENVNLWMKLVEVYKVSHPFFDCFMKEKLSISISDPGGILDFMDKVTGW